MGKGLGMQLATSKRWSLVEGRTTRESDLGLTGEGPSVGGVGDTGSEYL